MCSMELVGVHVTSLMTLLHETFISYVAIKEDINVEVNIFILLIISTMLEFRNFYEFIFCLYR